MTKTDNSDRSSFFHCFARNLLRPAHIAMSTVTCNLLSLSFKSRLYCANVCKDPCSGRCKTWVFYNFKTSRETSFNRLCTCYSINCNIANILLKLLILIFHALCCFSLFSPLFNFILFYFIYNPNNTGTSKKSCENKINVFMKVNISIWIGLAVPQCML
jgi:hypothetical protein